MVKFKKKWLWWLLVIPVGAFLTLAFVKSYPLGYLPHKHIAISLPFTPANDATNLIPMGEKIAHPQIDTGHPGIDFQWDHSVPIIASADGYVRDVTVTSDVGTDVYVRHGWFYETRYKEMVDIKVKKGDKVKKGQILGYPHCTTLSGPAHANCQLHWELASSSSNRGRFCPLLGYLDADSVRRITAIWDSVPPTDQFKSHYPDICSGYYETAHD